MFKDLLGVEAFVTCFAIVKQLYCKFMEKICLEAAQIRQMQVFAVRSGFSTGISPLHPTGTDNYKTDIYVF